VTARVSSFTACAGVLQRDAWRTGRRPPAAGGLGGEEVVDPPRRAHRNGLIGDPFHTSDGVEQDRDVDARGIHLLDPPVVQIVQPRGAYPGEFGGLKPAYLDPFWSSSPEKESP
jgi:hypothetical protein